MRLFGKKIRPPRRSAVKDWIVKGTQRQETGYMRKRVLCYFHDFKKNNEILALQPSLAPVKRGKVLFFEDFLVYVLF